MSVFALSVTKQFTWRGEAQNFSNVYHFLTGVGETFDDGLALDDVIAGERAIHATTVNFVQARTWGPVDGAPSANVTRVIRDLSSVGLAAATSNWYREFALLIVWPLGRYGSRNRPQFLRKWLHTESLNSITGAGFLTGNSQGTISAALTGYINDVTSVGPGPYDLCSASGHLPTGPGFLYPYLEHHQLGR